MAGMPLHRARQHARAARAPIQPLVRPDIWERMPAIDKIAVALKLSLNDILALVSIPWERADLHEQALKVRLFEALLKYGWQSYQEEVRQGEREQTLARLEGVMRAAQATTLTPSGRADRHPPPG